ncbi:MAG: hypothetical protein NZV14_18930 [Bryobacteraceae bacterium]|nr:hypothetical protein [Bryobacteraceae bacterium]MDW8380240.1 hypothetical protein [Bryobacterales bacterium]
MIFISSRKFHYNVNAAASTLFAGWTSRFCERLVHKTGRRTIRAYHPKPET